MPNLFVDGKWTAGSGGTVDVLNPYDAKYVGIMKALTAGTN